ncbi:DUF4174 domain-containing protein [Truepera radiovictrix]|uniref:DUF4174 domain-containing protein n=1 Tax=Truepera radiovictrix (strain DSM 17093 / CIP 108686 / LMG 22925 / RQ-24) TaxID=649638 RepID=D7CST5_TRURR|nr:DUF4174 domain-containing protein [Truepera radiovictrix]ADI13702.1 conserved hypothetical protein [Truepera radiovictrix DSM 17093]WMT57733.1 DUF4174 domain-containing protein [Truepera radiovictrix]
MQTADPLATHRGTHRLLLLFAPAADDARYLEQVRRLQGVEDALAERDLRVFHLFERGQGVAGSSEVFPETAQRLREAFSVAPEDFAAVLVGKDGTEKARYGAPVEPADLFGVIDQMPMQRQEMRERDGGA